MKAKLFALAALVLGMVSCQKEINGIAVDKNGEAAVTISVALPEEGATRAGGSNSAVGAIGNIDLVNAYDIRYILEVYDENGERAKRIKKFERESTQTSFDLRLVPGRHYRFVVWADFVNQDSEDALHYNAEDLTCVSLIDGSESYYSPMDETRDAYTGVYDTEKEGDREVFDSNSNIAITLTRPFAKLRVVTTDMKEIYSRLVSATVRYTSPLYNTFDALNATAKGDDTNVTKVVDFSTMTYTEEQPKVDGKQTLFADYLFGAEDDRVMFTLDVEDATGLDIPTVTFNTNIPVQRNYLTTVAGPILTDSNNITVTIEQDFAGYHEVEYVKAATAQELAEAIENAEEGKETHIVLEGDIDITDLFPGTTSTRANAFKAAVTIPANKIISLDIADKNVTYRSDYMNGAMIKNEGKLTIKGTGSLVYTYTGEADTANANGNYTINNAGELNLDANISIVADKVSDGVKFSHALYVINNGGKGKVNINGGLIYNGNGYAVRQFGDGDITVNDGEVKGSRAIWLQLPSNNTSLAPAINLTVNGGKLTSTGESAEYKLAVYSYTYGSKLNNVNIVVNDGEINGDIALTGGKNEEAEVEKVTIYGGRICGDIYSYGDDKEKAKESIVIYGGTFDNKPSNYVALGYIAQENNGVYTVKSAPMVVTGENDFNDGTIVITASPENTASTYGVVCPVGTATIKNLTIDGNNFVTTNGKGLRGIYVTKEADVTLENVVVRNVAYALNVNTTQTVKLTVKDSTLEGWSSYGGTTVASFNNVKFECGKYANFKPYSSTTLENCSFEAGFMIDFTSLNGVITFKNCTYNDVVLTAENFASVAKIDGDFTGKVAF